MICGNLVHPLDESRDKAITPKNELYAGGIDGVAIRSVLRKAAASSWDVATIDVKTAFLLAPCSATQQKLLTRPPKLLVEGGICPSTEVWEIAQAMYGLNTSPADWSRYRDASLRTMTWEEDGASFRLRQSPEGNVWAVMKTHAGGREEMTGQVVVYVDDIMVAAALKIAEALLNRVTQEWKCSPAEWASESQWTKFWPRS